MGVCACMYTCMGCMRVYVHACGSQKLSGIIPSFFHLIHRGSVSLSAKPGAHRYAWSLFLAHLLRMGSHKGCHAHRAFIHMHFAGGGDGMSREGKPLTVSQGLWVAVRPKHMASSTAHSAQRGCQVPWGPAHHQDRLNVTYSPFPLPCPLIYCFSPLAERAPLLQWHLPQW